MAQETKKLFFRDNGTGGFVTLRINREVATAVDLMSNLVAVCKDSSFQLPLADRLPCVIYVNYGRKQIAYQVRRHRYHADFVVFSHVWFAAPDKTNLQRVV